MRRQLPTFLRSSLAIEGKFDGASKTQFRRPAKGPQYAGKTREIKVSMDPIYVLSILSSKDWFSKLKKELPPGNLSPQYAVRVLQRAEDAALSLKLYLWICNSDERLAKERSIRRVLSDVLLRRGPVILSIALLNEIKTSGFQITEDVLCVLIQSWGKLGLVKYITEIFAQISFLGLKPTTRIYNSIIDSLIKSNSLDSAYLKFQQMLSDNCQPDRFTYNFLIHGVCKLGIVDEALRLLKQMESSGFSANVFTYTILVDGFCNARKIQEAFKILLLMKKNGIAPNEATYRSFIHGAFRSLDPKKAYQDLNELLERESNLCKHTFATVFYCLCKNKMTRQVQEFFEMTTQKGYVPESSLFGMIMGCLMKDHEVSKLCSIMDEFVHQGGKPGFDAYLMLITALCNEGRDDLIMKYVKQVIIFDVVSYNMLIDCFCKAKMMEKAMEVFDELENKGFLPNLVSFNTLISGYSKVGDVKKTRELLKMLLRHGFRPDAFTFSSMIDGLCRAHQLEDAFECYGEMDEWYVTPNSMIYNILIRSLCSLGQISRSMKMLSRMKACGIDPDIYSFNAIISCLCKMKKIEKARNLLDSMLQLGITPDSCTYHSFADALSNVDKVERAKEAIVAMEANG